MTDTPAKNEKRSAVFLDRDGTMIEDIGFLADPAGIMLYPDTMAALRRLQQTHVLFVITNQSGVGDGMLQMDQVDNVNSALARLLAEEGITIREWYVCPHSKADNCNCRKPKTEFLERAVQEHRIELRTSFAIGDHPHDATLGESLGVRGVYLLTGHGRKHQDELPAGKPVFEAIGQAAEWIEKSSA